MSNYTLTPRAQADVEGIWIYTIARWDEAQAVSYVQQIKKAAEVIAASRVTGEAVTTYGRDISSTASDHTSCFIARQ